MSPLQLSQRSPRQLMNFGRRFPQKRPRQHNKRKASPSPLFLVILLQLFLLTWAFIISLTVSVHDSDISTESHGATAVNPLVTGGNRSQLNGNVSLAHEIPGIELRISSRTTKNHQDFIQVIYPAKPTATRQKGIVLLLHACTHSALKFFSTSLTCPDCVGLSEELRIVRLVLERGYMPVSLSSVDRKSGCWSNADFVRIQTVLQHELFVNYDTVYAIGASSGGAFASQLLVRGLVRGTLVMVMSLSKDVVDVWKRNPQPLFLAPMPRDKGTTSAAIRNYEELKGLNRIDREMIVLDTKTCAPLPVTSSYLQERVPGMTADISMMLLEDLIRENHMDPLTMMLIVDPTQSNWREIVSPNNATHWLDKFALKPGYSPLAKALHRAWAFHEYCSEVVLPALEFFERALG
ncbi:hypothetical protein HJC23_001131 [Cyclotella cryptica]|uniref:Uncharacterized protein n=1 Tax=Cyclotella cryptica TaxID=29204 RepID=A0ABD3PIC1_9STRA